MHAKQTLEKDTNLKFGDKVRVMVNHNPGDPDNRWREIHTGRIVALTTSFAKVWKINSRSDEYESSNHEYSNWFPFNSKCMKVVKC